MEECEINIEERDVLKEARKIDERGMGKFGTLDRSGKAITILGDRYRWWPQTAKQHGDKISKHFPCNI